MDGIPAAARAIPLMREGQEHTSRYWRAGPDNPAAPGHLDAAVRVLDEAYGHLEPGDILRGQVAATLGWLLALRHTVHAGPDRDRETGIHLLEEAVAFPDLPPMQAGVAWLVLGQLYLGRVTANLKDSGFGMAALRGGAPSSTGSSDADRAAECFRQVLDGEPFNAELTGSAQAMLKVAEAMRTLTGGFGGGLGGFDLGRMMEALSALQDLQRQASTGGFGSPGRGMPAMPSFFDADRIATADPLDRPVAVLRGEEPATPGKAHPRTPVAIDTDALRRELPDVTALLDGTAVPDVDAVVGTATTIVHAGSAEPTDHLVLAAALHLRDRRGDGDGWGEEDGTGDARAAVDHLRCAADPALPAALVPALLRLAVALDARDAAAARFGPATSALRTVGAGALLYPDLARLDAATGRLAPPTDLPAGSVDGDATPAPPDAGTAPPPVGAVAGSRPARVVVAGADPVPSLGAVVSYVPSDAVLVELAGRTVPPVTARPVFVANPRGDRDGATMEAVVLRRAFYPRSTGLGNTGEHIDGAGTPDDVLARLDASLLHLGCGITAGGALELAGGGTLDAATIAASGAGAGGLAIAPPAAAGFAELAEALLAAGFTGVIGWLREVPAPVAAAAHLMLHAALVDDGRPPALAVHEVRRWLRDPDRVAPAHLPRTAATDLTDGRWWSALVHWGR